jgi:hypothetical protein
MANFGDLGILARPCLFLVFWQSEKIASEQARPDRQAFYVIPLS